MQLLREFISVKNRELALLADVAFKCIFPLFLLFVIVILIQLAIQRILNNILSYLYSLSILNMINVK